MFRKFTVRCNQYNLAANKVIMLVFIIMLEKIGKFASGHLIHLI